MCLLSTTLPQDKKYVTDIIRRDGIASALNWYKAFVKGFNVEDQRMSRTCMSHRESPNALFQQQPRRATRLMSRYCSSRARRTTFVSLSSAVE